MESAEKSDEPAAIRTTPATSDSPKTECQAVAQKLADVGVCKSRPGQWGLLTAVSEKATKRSQGLNITLFDSEHVLGRIGVEGSCLFESPAVSGRHCTITRKPISFDGRIKTPGSDLAAGDVMATFVKDSSSNGTFVNREKLKKNGPEARLRHGDVISLVALPEHENAFAFVFREVIDDALGKRRECPSDDHEEADLGSSKRRRGTGKGVSEGPVSLDDVRRLQRSNEELRQQVEANVLEMEKMRGEFRAAEALHLVELKEVRASVTEMHVKQIEEIRLELLSKNKEVEESTAVCVQQQSTIEDLNHRLGSAAQSRADAEEAILSHTTSIAELKKRLDDEFSQHQTERAEWEANLDAAVERTRMEASEEVKRHSENSARLQKQQQDIIVDLQEADKENRRLADSLRMKLEAERQAVIKAEEKGRRVGAQLQEERLSTEIACRKFAELEEELRKVYKKLENEKEAKESAGAKVASLELAMETAIRDLTLEKQRLQGARERIVLRETQLRAFYSTAAQVEALQQKQQEQLKTMLRTLEDGDGDGDYSQSKQPKLRLGQSESGTDEARILISLASKQMPSPPGVSLLVKDTGLGSLEGDGEGEELAVEGDGSDQKTDWMDGDTQQEDENFLVVSNFPSTSNALINGTGTSVGAQIALVKEEDGGTKVTGSYQDTQMLQDHGMPATTQLLADTQQLIGTIEGEALLKESGFRTGFSKDSRKSRLGRNVDAPVLVTRVDGIEQAEKEDVDVCPGAATMEIPEDFPERTPIDSVGQNGVPPASSPRLNEGMRMDDDTKAERKNNEPLAATLCTDDLVTSEVAGSWALGTQASVHTGNEAGSHWNMERKISAAHEDTQLEGREHEGTMCTDDLMASEMAGSWAAGTPASVHADNESMSSDESDHPGPEEGGSQVAASHAQGSRPRATPHRVLLEEVLQFADPVNSQNSLSPATTNPARNERNALNDMLDIVEPGFGSLHGLSRISRHQSDVDDSTTDDENENEDVNTTSDGSQPLNHSPPVSVR